MKVRHEWPQTIFDSGTNLGPLLLKGVDRQFCPTERLCAAIDDTRHPACITHTLHDLLRQRIWPAGELDQTPEIQFGVGPDYGIVAQDIVSRSPE